MKPFQLKSKRFGDVLVLSIAGDADSKSATSIREELDRHLASVPHGKALINLAKLNYIDSVGLGAMMSSLSQAKRQSIAIKISDATPMVRSVFNLMNMEALFDLHGSQVEAMRSFEDEPKNLE